jgi:ubiquinol-cytochrome c reductase cytochrome c1 subunit
MKAILNLVATLMLCVAGAAFAAEEGARMVPAPINPLDEESLQRGAKLFVNYCLNCHSAKYMRYNRLTEIGLTEQQIKDNLMFATDKIGATMTVAMPADRAKGWFGTAPPDLSVEARVRGPQWLYNYMLSFYRDEKTPSGWNNLVFPNVAMPHVLWELQGVQKLVEEKFPDEEKATAYAIGVKGIALVEPAGPHEYRVLTVAPDVAGKLNNKEYEIAVADIVNFLDFIAEPSKVHRVRLGLIVLAFLGVLFGLAYWTKREYWKDVH